MRNIEEKQKAIIYVRGHKKEYQEIICLLYAKDSDYEVLFVTDNMDDVYNFKDECDVLVALSASRISRDKIEYYETLNKLKEHGIKVDTAANGNVNVDRLNEYLRFAYNIAK